MLAAVMSGLIGCDDGEAVEDAGASAEDGAVAVEDAGRALDGGRTELDAGDALDGGALTPDAGPDDAGVRLGANAWIRAHFVDAPAYTGTFNSRRRIETPALVHDADACCAKYAFDPQAREEPDVREIGFVDVFIHDLVSSDAFGGGIQSANASGLTLFLADVIVEPNWPAWRSYSETNYDGLVLDHSAAFYAEDLTVRGWNADGAIDNKAPISQFVRLTLEGSGHRGIRFWRPGPHYLVASDLRNEGAYGEGSLLWFRNCDTVEVRVWDTTFNGESTVPGELISCDEGSGPNIVYLTDDPRTTGEMHEMFSY